MISTCSKREVSSQFKLKSAKLTSVGIVASSHADAFSWNDILEDKQYSCFFFFFFFFFFWIGFTFSAWSALSFVTW